MDNNDVTSDEDMSKGLEVQIEDFEARGEANLPEVQSISLIQLALEKKYDPALIEKMMDLQERNEARLAKQAYVAAMAAFKADPPKIIKDRSVAFQPSGKAKVEYSYADLATSLEAINAALSPHGLFASWTTDQANGAITVACVISHSMGHSEFTKLTADPDDTGSKNKIQAMGSTIYYLMRYTLFALIGIAAHGEDTDAGGPVEYINDEQKKTITDLIDTAKDGDLSVFLKWAKVDSLDEMPKDLFSKAVAALKAKQ